MTVTGVTVPSSAKICVIPNFLPMIPLIIIFVRCRTHESYMTYGTHKSYKPFANILALAKRLDLNINAGRQIQFHQRIYCFGGRIENVHKTLVRPDLELL